MALDAAALLKTMEDHLDIEVAILARMEAQAKS